MFVWGGGVVVFFFFLNLNLTNEKMQRESADKQTREEFIYLKIIINSSSQTTAEPLGVTFVTHQLPQLEFAYSCLHNVHRCVSNYSITSITIDCLCLSSGLDLSSHLQCVLHLCLFADLLTDL